MKIRLFIAALSAMALGACTQYDTETPEVRKTIGFSIDDMTRADIRVVESVREDGFRFSVDWAGEETYSNAMSSWNGTGFVTDPVMVWPLVSESQPCIFNAVSYPGIPAEPILYNEGKYSFQYEVATQADAQQDVLVASVTATEIPEDGIQRMMFAHALTKVNFTVYVDDNEVNNGYLWRVSSISLKAKDKGVYTFGEETPWSVSDSYADMQYLQAEQTFDLSNGKSWKGMNNFMLVPQAGENLTVTLTWAVYRKTGDMLVKVSKRDATRRYTITTEDWHPGASLRYSSLRLPNIGENTGTGDEGYDDNNMNGIGYNPDCN